MQSIDFFSSAEKYASKNGGELAKPSNKRKSPFEAKVFARKNFCLEDILEDYLLGETRELARLLLQGHIDSRGDGDIGATIISTEKVKLQKSRKTQRSLKTVFGFVTYQSG